MKDLPHHIKKLNRQVIRSIHKLELEEGQDFEMPPIPNRKPSSSQVKKQAKSKLKKERENRAPLVLTPDERNKKMKYRVPVFDRTNNAEPKHAGPSKKKTPRI
ncbi:MAG: hypothetical protein V4487_07890 [Chlamydiota bacterium]